MELDEALKIIEKHKNSVPVETIPLARDLGLKVYYSDWPDNISGCLKRDEKSKSGYSIFVNTNHHPNRRRFTIAHEIAHFVLHRDLIGDGITDDKLYRSGMTNKVEAQANSFAADILMPRPQLRKDLEDPDASMEGLARKYGVSKAAMSIRLGVPYD